jgi:hypothetical protein
VTKPINRDELLVVAADCIRRPAGPAAEKARAT